MNLTKFHSKPCHDCGHQDKHSEVSGCIAMTGNTFCTCTTYVEPPSAKVARTIPSRSQDPGTSHQAAQAITVKANTQRGRLLAAWGALEDATDEEAMEKAEGVSPVSEYAKRSSELRDAGLIEATGEARKGSAGTPRIVSRITDEGRRVLASLQ